MKSAIKQFIKKRVILRYNDDGSFYVYVRFPLRIDSTVKYKLLYARRPIVRNKIIFENYMGKGYGDNPKQIAQTLLEKYPGQYDLVWVVKKEEEADSCFPAGIRTVRYQSPESYREYATAGVWVSNYHKIAYVKRGLRKRDGQYFIQTWHGSLGIKKIENDVPSLNADVNWHRLAKLSSQMVDLWISNSRWETEIFRRAFWEVNNVLEAGHPRNDVLFGEGQALAREKVRERYEIGDRRILFYAPTFREDYRLDCYDIGFAGVRRALKKKFGGDWVILVRIHPRIQKYASKVIPDDAFIKDATKYEDIQELVAAADVMITDYSSCIFDFVLTGRPGFLFAPDEKEYDQERGFYYPLSAAPFPVSHTREELEEQILDFDEERYRKDVERFLKEKGCMEDGHASERVVEKIVEYTGTAP